jgi:Fe-S cluster assembly protein SufB
MEELVSSSSGCPKEDRSEAERDSEAVFQERRGDLERLGVILSDLETAVLRHPEKVRSLLMRIVPSDGNGHTLLNAAFWTRGVFLWVPAGVVVPYPVQIESLARGDYRPAFDRTLIVVGEGGAVDFIEGCTSQGEPVPMYRSATVEVSVGPRARLGYTTVQHWSRGVTNVVRSRAQVGSGGALRWVDGNWGSGYTLKRPEIVLSGAGARAEVHSLAFAGEGQRQEVGAHLLHQGKRTSCEVETRLLSCGGGRVDLGTRVSVDAAAGDSKVSVRSEHLDLDGSGGPDLAPRLDFRRDDVQLSRVERNRRIETDQVDYGMARGWPAAEARRRVACGFLEPFLKVLPMVYAVELKAFSSAGF